jgi:uncharacterized membrane protein
MTRLPRLLGRSALAGAATGSRSLTAVAALELSASPAARAQPDRTLANPKVKLAASALAAQEWVTDKLPITPSRLKAAGLVPRLAGDDDPAGDGAPPVTVAAACALTATAAAGGAAWLGARWREAGAPWLGHDWIAALIEDAVAVGLDHGGNPAAGAARRALPVVKIKPSLPLPSPGGRRSWPTTAAAGPRLTRARPPASRAVAAW